MFKALAIPLLALAICAVMTTSAIQAPTIGSNRVPAEWEPQEAIWLVGNGFVITVGFGDDITDAVACKRIEGHFPGRDVHIIEMLASWYDAGGVYCHSNDQPAL